MSSGSWQKFKCPPDMLTAEEKLKTLQLTDDQAQELIMSMVEANMTTAPSKEERKAWAAIKVQRKSKRMTKQIKEAFVEDFVLWLQGRSPYNVKEREEASLENGIRKRKTVHYTPWGNKPITSVKGASEFLTGPILNRDKVIKTLTKLECTLPRNIDEAWIYYKYLVRKVGIDIDSDMVKEQHFYNDYDYLEKNPQMLVGGFFDPDAKLEDDPDYTVGTPANPKPKPFDEQKYQYAKEQTYHAAAKGEPAVVTSDEFNILSAQDKVFALSLLRSSIKPSDRDKLNDETLAAMQQAVAEMYGTADALVPAAGGSTVDPGKQKAVQTLQTGLELLRGYLKKESPSGTKNINNEIRDAIKLMREHTVDSTGLDDSLRTVNHIVSNYNLETSKDLLDSTMNLLEEQIKRLKTSTHATVSNVLSKFQAGNRTQVEIEKFKELVSGLSEEIKAEPTAFSEPQEGDQHTKRLLGLTIELVWNRLSKSVAEPGPGDMVPNENFLRQHFSVAADKWLDTIMEKITETNDVDQVVKELIENDELGTFYMNALDEILPKSVFGQELFNMAGIGTSTYAQSLSMVTALNTAFNAITEEGEFETGIEQLDIARMAIMSKMQEDDFMKNFKLQDDASQLRMALAFNNLQQTHHLLDRLNRNNMLTDATAANILGVAMYSYDNYVSGDNDSTKIITLPVHVKTMLNGEETLANLDEDDRVAYRTLITDYFSNNAVINPTAIMNDKTNIPGFFHSPKDVLVFTSKLGKKEAIIQEEFDKHMNEKIFSLMPKVVPKKKEAQREALKDVLLNLFEQNTKSTKIKMFEKMTGEDSDYWAALSEAHHWANTDEDERNIDDFMNAEKLISDLNEKHKKQKQESMLDAKGNMAMKSYREIAKLQDELSTITLREKAYEAFDAFYTEIKDTFRNDRALEKYVYFEDDLEAEKMIEKTLQYNATIQRRFERAVRKDRLNLQARKEAINQKYDKRKMEIEARLQATTKQISANSDLATRLRTERLAAVELQKHLDRVNAEKRAEIIETKEMHDFIIQQTKEAGQMQAKKQEAAKQAAKSPKGTARVPKKPVPVKGTEEAEEEAEEEEEEAEEEEFDLLFGKDKHDKKDPDKGGDGAEKAEEEEEEEEAEEDNAAEKAELKKKQEEEELRRQQEERMNKVKEGLAAVLEMMERVDPEFAALDDEQKKQRVMVRYTIIMQGKTPGSEAWEHEMENIRRAGELAVENRANKAKQMEEEEKERKAYEDKKKAEEDRVRELEEQARRLEEQERADREAKAKLEAEQREAEENAERERHARTLEAFRTIAYDAFYRKASALYPLLTKEQLHETTEEMLEEKLADIESTGPDEEDYVPNTEEGYTKLRDEALQETEEIDKTTARTKFVNANKMRYYDVYKRLHKGYKDTPENLFDNQIMVYFDDEGLDRAEEVIREKERELERYLRGKQEKLLKKQEEERAQQEEQRKQDAERKRLLEQKIAEERKKSQEEALRKHMDMYKKLPVTITEESIEKLKNMTSTELRNLIYTIEEYKTKIPEINIDTPLDIQEQIISSRKEADTAETVLSEIIVDKTRGKFQDALLDNPEDIGDYQVELADRIGNLPKLAGDMLRPLLEEMGNAAVDIREAQKSKHALVPLSEEQKIRQLEKLKSKPPGKGETYKIAVQRLASVLIDKEREKIQELEEKKRRYELEKATPPKPGALSRFTASVPSLVEKAVATSGSLIQRTASLFSVDPKQTIPLDTEPIFGIDDLIQKHDKHNLEVRGDQIGNIRFMFTDLNRVLDDSYDPAKSNLLNTAKNRYMKLAGNVPLEAKNTLRQVIEFVELKVEEKLYNAQTFESDRKAFTTMKMIYDLFDVYKKSQTKKIDTSKTSKHIKPETKMSVAEDYVIKAFHRTVPKTTSQYRELKKNLTDYLIYGRDKRSLSTMARSFVTTQNFADYLKLAPNSVEAVRQRSVWKAQLEENKKLLNDKYKVDKVRELYGDEYAHALDTRERLLGETSDLMYYLSKTDHVQYAELRSLPGNEDLTQYMETAKAVIQLSGQLPKMGRNAKIVIAAMQTLIERMIDDAPRYMSTIGKEKIKKKLITEYTVLAALDLPSTSSGPKELLDHPEEYQKHKNKYQHRWMKRLREAAEEKELFTEDARELLSTKSAKIDDGLENDWHQLMLAGNNSNTSNMVNMLYNSKNDMATSIYATKDADQSAYALRTRRDRSLPLQKHPEYNLMYLADEQKRDMDALLRKNLSLTATRPDSRQKNLEDPETVMSDAPIPKPYIADLKHEVAQAKYMVVYTNKQLYEGNTLYVTNELLSGGIKLRPESQRIRFSDLTADDLLTLLPYEYNKQKTEELLYDEGNKMIYRTLNSAKYINYLIKTVNNYDWLKRGGVELNQWFVESYNDMADQIGISKKREDTNILSKGEEVIIDADTNAIFQTAREVTNTELPAAVDYYTQMLTELQKKEKSQTSTIVYVQNVLKQLDVTKKLTTSMLDALQRTSEKMLPEQSSAVALQLLMLPMNVMLYTKQSVQDIFSKVIQSNVAKIEQEQGIKADTEHSLLAKDPDVYSVLSGMNNTYSPKQPPDYSAYETPVKPKTRSRLPDKPPVSKKPTETEPKTRANPNYAARQSTATDKPKKKVSATARTSTGAAVSRTVTSTRGKRL
jgi:hypothetical protein